MILMKNGDIINQGVSLVYLFVRSATSLRSTSFRAKGELLLALPSSFAFRQPHFVSVNEEMKLSQAINDVQTSFAMMLCPMDTNENRLATQDDF